MKDWIARGPRIIPNTTSLKLKKIIIIMIFTILIDKYHIWSPSKKLPPVAGRNKCLDLQSDITQRESLEHTALNGMFSSDSFLPLAQGTPWKRGGRKSARYRRMESARTRPSKSTRQGSYELTETETASTQST